MVRKNSFFEKSAPDLRLQGAEGKQCGICNEKPLLKGISVEKICARGGGRAQRKSPSNRRFLIEFKGSFCYNNECMSFEFKFAK
ncbi:MAG: hypothetical protein E7223_00885 [Clostridiales bacterium]|nr:hypothetical protein [Clostridiales bacterium]